MGCGEEKNGHPIQNYKTIQVYKSDKENKVRYPI